MMSRILSTTHVCSSPYSTCEGELFAPLSLESAATYIPYEESPYRKPSRSLPLLISIGGCLLLRNQRTDCRLRFEQSMTLLEERLACSLALEFEGSNFEPDTVATIPHEFLKSIRHHRIPASCLLPSWRRCTQIMSPNQSTQ
jgi:hypothetical protein